MVRSGEPHYYKMIKIAIKMIKMVTVLQNNGNWSQNEVRASVKNYLSSE